MAKPLKSFGFAAGRWETREGFKTYIRALKQRAGVTTEQLAQALGVSQRTVAFWYSGRTVPGESSQLRIVLYELKLLERERGLPRQQQRQPVKKAE